MPLKIGGIQSLRCSERVSSFCSTKGMEKVVPVNFCMVPILRSKKRRKLTKLWKNDKNLIQKYFYTGETVSGFHS
jgi:hypothetical protein